MARSAWIIGALALALGRPATAADGTIEARRTGRAPVIDGRPDEPLWAEAPPFSNFVDYFPEEGSAPSESTEVRVLYDSENLYFAFICHDSRPDQIVRRLGDRDAPPVSDTVEVSIDVAHDRRTAYLFGVNAAGVQYDKLLYADNQSTLAWDAVWDAKVAARPDGWSAEMAVPLRLFRFSPAAIHLWGMMVRRHLARTHEDIASVLLPRNSNGYVSLFGDLAGLSDLRPRPNLELLPYLASRVTMHPQFSDPTSARPRIADPSLDVGLDVRAVISRLQLNATLNPDFSQVETDQLILNLTNQEAVFPEKRPFFFQGTEIFQPVANESDLGGGQILFYSRRVGLTTPILGAAKLTGELGPQLNIGLLDAFVTGTRAEMIDEASPDRTIQFHPQRPLHLGPNNEALSSQAVPENYFAGVLTYKLGGASTVGARAASAVPFPGRCPPAVDREGKPVETACTLAGGNAGAVDWSLKTIDAKWAFLGQAEVSQAVGGPAVRILPDGTLIQRGQTGWGTFLQAGKVGGEPFRFDVNFAELSPTLELNGAGFMPTQNQRDLVGKVELARPRGFAGLHSFSASLSGHARWTADGRALDRGRNANFIVSAVLPGFHTIGIDTGYELSRFDVLEIPGSGVPLQKIPLYYFSASGESDPARMFSVNGSFARDWTMPTAVTPGRPGYTVQLGLLLRPQSRFESRLNLAVNHEPQGPRWTTQMLGSRYLFGDLQSGYLSVTFRQQVVLLPHLVLQAYGQLFTAYGQYQSFFEAAPVDHQPIRFGDLLPSNATADGFYQAGLRVNLVARWEYRLGSTLFLVYNHARESIATPGQPVPSTLTPAGLLAGRTADLFMIKWSYFLNL